MTADDVKNRVLRFSVYDVDKRKVRHSLGHVMVPLRDVDLGHVDTYWSDLEPMSQVCMSACLPACLLYASLSVPMKRKSNDECLKEHPKQRRFYLFIYVLLDFINPSRENRVALPG